MMKHLFNKLSAFLVMLMCVSATMQAEIVHHTVCQPTLTSRGFTRECWENTETGQIYADEACTQEIVDDDLAKAVTYMLLRENPIVNTLNFSQSKQETARGVTFNWAATTAIWCSRKVIDYPTHYAEFKVTADNVSNARLVYYVKILPYMGGFRLRIRVNGTEKLVKDWSYSSSRVEQIFVLPLSGLKKGDVVKFEVAQGGTSFDEGEGAFFKASLEYIGKFANDDNIPPLVHQTEKLPTLRAYGFTRECWEDISTRKLYADPVCVEEYEGEEYLRTCVYAKLPNSPITATSDFNQSESETVSGVTMNWAGVTTYTHSGSDVFSPEPRWVEFTPSAGNEERITNVRLVWSKDCEFVQYGIYTVVIYVNGTEKYRKSQGNSEVLDGVFVAALPDLKNGDVVRFEVMQTVKATWAGSPTFKASLEYNVVPCTHEYPAGSAICSMCGYVKPHTHTYNPIHECTQCGYFDESSIIMSGDLGDNIKWRLFNDWTLYYYGTGEMEAFNIEHNAWKKNYRDDVKKIIIDEGITKVGDGEHGYELTSYFGFMWGLTEAILPSTLKSIGNSAFEYSSLSIVTLPEGLESIADHAFRASKIENIVIPASVKTLGQQAFGSCPLLKSVTLMGAPTTITEYAFYNPVGLKDFYLMSDEEIYVTDNVFIYNSASLKNATLHVNNNLYFLVLKTSPWNKFPTIVPLLDFNIEYTDAENNMQGKYFDIEASDNAWTLTDGAFKSLTVKKDIPMQTLTYTRNFSAANQWQALYVPFEMEPSDWADKFDVAAINNFHEYTNEDGVTEKIELEVRYVKSGKLRANTPYLIRAKVAGQQSIVLNNVTLKASAVKSVDCSSTEHRYAFTGTYAAIDGLKSKDYIFLSGGKLCKANNNTDVLKPMRWYLTIEDYFSLTNPAAALSKPMDIRVIGEEDELTGVEEITVVSSPKESVASGIYNVSGVQFAKPQQGVNIVNGKKVLVK